jgi:hypothetical protein
MIQCQYCIHWVDENLRQIEVNRSAGSRLVMGCRIYGFRETTALESCSHYAESENLFALCDTCHVTVPKACISLGECANCIDTDLFCVDHCLGGDQRKYCTHFIRLYTEGAHLIDQDRTYDLFPDIGMPGKRADAAQAAETTSSSAASISPVEETHSVSNAHDNCPTSEDPPS